MINQAGFSALQSTQIQNGSQSGVSSAQNQQIQQEKRAQDNKLQENRSAESANAQSSNHTQAKDFQALAKRIIDARQANAANVQNSIEPAAERGSVLDIVV